MRSKSAIVLCLTWKVFVTIITLICFQNTPPVLQHAHAVCRQKWQCPLDNKCLSASLIHKAAVSETPTPTNKHFYGTYEKSFKERYSNHTATFRNKSKQKSTEFSEHIWKLKGNSIQHQISWNIASRACPYNGCTWKCDLCLTEKLMKAKIDPSSLLTHDEFISKCRHKKKFALKHLKNQSMIITLP